MILLKYNDRAEYHEVSFKRVSEHVVKVTGCVDRGLKGFKTFNTSGVQLGDFSKYTTVYKNPDDYEVWYSDDGSVYAEPEVVEKPIPTKPLEQIKQELIDGVQNYMDEVASSRGYDGILSVCTYINTGVERFDNEGELARRWRSAVWEYCYAQLDLVLAGQRGIPTIEELIAELPVMDW